MKKFKGSINYEYGEGPSQQKIWSGGYGYLKTFQDLTYIDACLILPENRWKQIIAEHVIDGNYYPLNLVRFNPEEKVTLKLGNQHDYSLNVFWKNRDGEESKVANLGIGETVELSTYFKHTFVFRSDQGEYSDEYEVNPLEGTNQKFISYQKQEL